jgi:hypothetical protein
VNNDCIEKVIICGSIKLNDYFFSGLDIEFYCYPNDSKFYKYFCLTEHELVEYVNGHRLNVSLQRLKECYGGYIPFKGSEEKVFKLMSVLNCMKKGYNEADMPLLPITDIARPLILQENLIVRKRLDEIINMDGSGFVFHNQVFTLNDFLASSDVLRAKSDDADIDNCEMDLFISFLFSNGCFTLHDSLQSDWCTYIQVPNEEAKFILLGNVARL